MAKYTKEEQIKMLEEKLKVLKNQEKKEERKMRAKKLIEVGAYFSSIADVHFMHDIIKNDTEGKLKKYVGDYYPIKDKVANFNLQKGKEGLAL